ncbi:TPA: hypothetical protein PXN76_000446 [Yersinia enterocolitica]|nr:hypothetical protein [Yersinia enterocolitica]HDL7502086.1 hypothetical protein [Yersinia enterocolitica]
MKKKGLIALSIVMFAVLVGQFIYTIYNNTFEPSSYTDWISAFCNIIMAGATVVAVLVAKNYVAQFTAQEGYKIAIELVNDVFPKHEGLKKVVPLCNTALTIVNKVLEQESVSGKEMFTLKSILSECSSMSENANSVYIEVSKLLFKTKTYGLYPSHEREYYFYNFINNVEIANFELKELVNELKSIIKNTDEFNMCRHNGVARKDGVNFYDRDIVMDNIKGNSLSSLLGRFNATVKQMSSSHKDFIGKDNTITELFKVKGLLF